jgi:hypothetical protein
VNALLKTEKKKKELNSYALRVVAGSAARVYSVTNCIRYIHEL